jgi:arabinan endo-1,5-alpha-L-arabinosidase
MKYPKVKSWMLRSQTAVLVWLLVYVLGCADAAVDANDKRAETCTRSVPDYTPLVQTGDIAAHDPAAIWVDDAVYLFSTGHRIPIRRSTDLINWQLIGFVFASDVPEWAPQIIPGVEFPWAPDIQFFNDRYHLYYALSSAFGGQRSAIALATNVTLDPSSPDYRWEDQGVVIESRPNQDPYNAIDPNVAFDEAGNPWLVWGSYWEGIFLRRLDAATGKPSTEDPTLYHLAERPVERAIEAPFIVREGGYYYLFVSFDACCQGAESTYRVMVGRSESITGPYVDHTGRLMLEGGGTLVLQSYGRIRGPGHNGVFRDGEGRWFCAHHFYDRLDGGRIKMQVRPLLWRSGWPVVGEAYDGTYPGEALREGVVLEGEWGYSVDYGQGVRVRLGSGGGFQVCGGDGRWQEQGRWHLEDSELVLVRGEMEERLVLEPKGRWAVGRSAQGRIVRLWKTTG